MKCNCISDIEKRLAAHYAAELKVPATANCQNTGLGINGNTCVTIHFTNFKVTAEAKGFTKGKVMPVHANYCPFCGKDATTGEKANDKALTPSEGDPKLTETSVSITYSADDGYSAEQDFPGVPVKDAPPEASLLDGLEELARLTALFGFGAEAKKRFDAARKRVAEWRAGRAKS